MNNKYKISLDSDNVLDYMKLGYKIISSLQNIIFNITEEFLKTDMGVYQSLLSQSFIIKHVFEDEALELKNVGIYGIEILVSTSFGNKPKIEISSLLVDTLFFSCAQHIYNFPELHLYNIKIISNIKKDYLHISNNVIETVSLKNVNINVLDIKNLNQYKMYRLANIHKVKTIQLNFTLQKDNSNSDFIELLTNLLVDIDNFRDYSGELNVSVYFDEYSDESFLMFKEELRDSLKYYKSGSTIYNAIDKEMSEIIKYTIAVPCWRFNHYKISKADFIKSKIGL